MIHDKILLGVNIDHVATLRNARGTHYPEPVHAGLLAEQSGADSITVHLREDRRHIKDRDVEILAKTLTTKLNLELAVTPEMINIGCAIKPDFVCLVPEKREEITTEGGLDVITHMTSVTEAVKQLQDHGIRVSLFIDADPRQLDAAQQTGAEMIEIHTGAYADEENTQEQLSTIIRAVEHGVELGLQVNAGHGLHYHNVKPIAAIPGIVELNIGHAIIARSVFSGLAGAVSEMKRLMLEARE